MYVHVIITINIAMISGFCISLILRVSPFLHVYIQVNEKFHKIKCTKVQNPRRNKCSAVLEKNCVVAEYRVPYRIGPHTIIMLIIIHMRTAN